MMYSRREPPIHHPGRPRRGDMSPLPPSSPINYSPQPQDLSTPTSPVSLPGMDCPSPIKAEGAYFPHSPVIKRESISLMKEVPRFSPPSMKCEPHSPAMKLEPTSPPSSVFTPASIYASRGAYKGAAMDWQTSPSPGSGDTPLPLSPMSNGGAANLTAVSSPMTSPLSPSSTATLSPSTKSGHEGSSPAPSVVIDNDRKGRKPSSRQSEELCLVCGDRSSGYHYNALTCEGCKGFFRRSITKAAIYNCKFGGHCEIDMYMRRKCQECRFNKCLNVGMRPECVTQTPDSTPSTGVIPEHACLKKRKQKTEREKKKDPVASTDFSQGGRPPDSSPVPVQRAFMQGTLSRHDEECINRLIFYQDRFETPSEENIRKMKKNLASAGKLNNYNEITAMAKLTTELIVDFIKFVPGFTTLEEDDQVILIKASTPEIMALRAARKYHKSTNTILFADNEPRNQNDYSKAVMEPGTTEALFYFCKRMESMEVDNAEYALLTAIVAFSDRPHLHDPLKAEKMQLAYVETLRSYVTNKWHPKHSNMFAKLLDVLTHLRTLGVLLWEQCQQLLEKNMEFPELLLEIWT